MCLRAYAGESFYIIVCADLLLHNPPPMRCKRVAPDAVEKCEICRFVDDFLLYRKLIPNCLCEMDLFFSWVIQPFNFRDLALTC